MSDPTQTAGDSPAPLRSARERPWPIVDREAELGEIAAAWARVEAGGRETVLVEGEPGAGKSRLVAEAAATVAGAGGLVLYGSGDDSAETPYTPFAAALRELDRRLPGLLDDARRSPLGVLMADASSQGDLPLNLDDDRGKLFAATASLLERLGEDRPVLLAIDDLHACGASTLALVGHLARTAAPLRLLLLVTYRPTEIEPGGEQATAIADLRSAPGTRHLRLAGLGAPALREVAAALAPAERGVELDRVAEEAARESGGNALFACELLRAIGEGEIGGESPRPSAPPSLRILIATRARALGPEAYRCLEAAAVCGREFDPALLAAILDLPRAEVSASLARAARAGLLAADPDGGGWAFGHAISARCLYEELDPARRGALHRRAAEALEAETGERLAGELARHWRLAEPPEPQRAAACSEAAGRHALRGYDHEVAAGWFEAALALRDEGGGGGAGGAGRCDLLTGLGIALRYTNQERSRECLLEAARLADELGEIDRLTTAALANHRGFVSQVGGFDRERAAMLRRAGERLDGSGPESALVLAQLAQELTFTDQVDRRRWLADSALAAARESGDRRVLARVLVRCLIARWDPDNAVERIAMAAESIEIWAELDEPLELFHALHWQAMAQLEIRQVEAAARSLREGERIADRVGDATARWLCEWAESLHLSLRGELEQAEACAQQAAEWAKRSGQPDALLPYVSQLCSIRWQEDRMDELAPLLARALNEYPGIPGFRSLVALANAEAGELAFAREVLATDTATRFEAIPRDPFWLASIVDYAYAVARLGDAEAAALLHPVLEPYRGRLATTTVAVWGVADHALGRLELLLGREDEGRRSLRAAIDAYATMGAPLWRSRAEADLGAEATAESALEKRIDALGLTERQAEVTRLIARGLSNREIAERLQISPSTVKRHLENVYRHTGVRSRSALAALLLK